MKNSIENPTFGAETIISYDSAEHGINPENEHIIIDTCIVKDSNGNQETWAAVRRLDSVRVIAEKDGEIYFAKQTMPNGSKHYTAFGGSVLPGETPEEAAKREFKEEAGMEGDLELLMHWQNPDLHLNWGWSIFIAHNARIVDKQQLDPTEKIEIVKAPNFEEFVKIMANMHLKENPNAIPFKDTNLLEILNNYVPINPLAIQAVNTKITNGKS